MIFPIQVNDSYPDSEKLVFRLLKNQFGSSSDVFTFHSVRIQSSRSRNREVEIDFVIATLNCLICIEVKGGLIEYKPELDVWMQNNREIKSPIEQSISNKHAFIERFRSDLNDIPVYWACCFPNVSTSNVLPANISDENIIDSSKLGYLSEYLKSVESHAIKIGRSRDSSSRNARYALKRIVGTLTRRFGFEPSIKSNLQANDIVFAQLLDQQIEIVKGLEGNKRLLILGDAGSGKSLVGLHQLMRRYELGERVLFLTFNRELAKNFSFMIQREYSVRENESMEITNFHRFAKEIITKAAYDWWDAGDQKDSDFWDLEVPVKLDEILDVVDVKYDLVVVDEAQDFLEIWLEPIVKLLGEEGKLSLLMDRKQDIYKRSSAFSSMGFSSFQLDKVIRSCKKNTTFVNETLGLALNSHSQVPEGYGVIDLRSSQDKPNDLRKQLRNIGVKAKEVTFIYSPEIGLKEFGDFNDGRDDIKKSRSPYARRGEISAVSVSLMKGLESNIIGIVGIDQMSAAEKYVAMTRSKSLMFLL